MLKLPPCPADGPTSRPAISTFANGLRSYIRLPVPADVLVPGFSLTMLSRITNTKKPNVRGSAVRVRILLAIEGAVWRGFEPPYVLQAVRNWTRQTDNPTINTCNRVLPPQTCRWLFAAQYTCTEVPRARLTAAISRQREGDQRLWRLLSSSFVSGVLALFCCH
jgi:hypothetical protein